MQVRLILAATAALSLTACNKSAESADSAAQASASAPAPASSTAPLAATPSAAPASVEPGSAPTKEFLIGKWAEAGECELALQFNADGTMVGPFERWTLDGGVLAMEGNPSKIHLKVVSANEMESRIDGTGSPHKLIRCP